MTDMNIAMFIFIARNVHLIRFHLMGVAVVGVGLVVRDLTHFVPIQDSEPPKVSKKTPATTAR